MPKILRVFRIESGSDFRNVTKRLDKGAGTKWERRAWTTALIFYLGSIGLAFAGGAEISEASLLWDKSLNLRGGFGYKDNVLLRSTGKAASEFGAFGFDAMILRLPIHGPQFTLFVTGDDNRYLRDIGVDKEQTLVAAAKLDVPWSDGWEAGLGVQYVYQDQVFDVSATETDLTTLRLKGHGIKGTPSLSRKLSDQWKVQAEFPVTRQFLAAPLDDYWSGGPKISLERGYGRRSFVSLSYGFDWRSYDKREQFDPRGAIIPETSLRFYLHEFELINRHYWDVKRHWRNDTKLGFDWNQDSGSGFFDYFRYYASEQFRWATDDWNIKAQARLSYYDYPVQTVSFESSEKRNLMALTLTFRAERKLAKKLKLFVEFEHEQNLSNRAINEYRANTVTGGLDWEL